MNPCDLEYVEMERELRLRLKQSIEMSEKLFQDGLNGVAGNMDGLLIFLLRTF